MPSTTTTRKMLSSPAYVNRGDSASARSPSEKKQGGINAILLLWECLGTSPSAPTFQSQMKLGDADPPAAAEIPVKPTAAAVNPGFRLQNPRKSTCKKRMHERSPCGKVGERVRRILAGVPVKLAVPTSKKWLVIVEEGRGKWVRECAALSGLCGTEPWLRACGGH
jgi:hypothetical protein